MARNWISTTTSRFLSTLSLRRATALDRLKSQATVISIHALLAESDRRPDRLWRAYHGNFYPRSPCGERLKPVRDKRTLDQFLSTLSLRRATPICQWRRSLKIFLSTLSLRRATENNGAMMVSDVLFLSTLSLRRATACVRRMRGGQQDFYPRSPCGERRGWSP